MAEYKRDDDIQYCLAEYYDEFARIPMDLLNMIDSLPSIDIIHCSECRYAKTCCQNVIDDPDGMPDKLYYCSHGER